MSKCEEKVPFTVRFGNHKDLIMHFQEILLFKRPLVLAFLLAYTIGFFVFAHATEAGFCACVLLFITAIYTLCIIHSFFGSKFDQLFFSPLKEEDTTASNRVRSFEELGEFFDKHCHCCCHCHRNCNNTPRVFLIHIAIFLVLGLFFIAVPPFWFNFVVIILAMLLPGILLHPSVNPHLPAKLFGGSSSEAPAPVTESSPIPETPESSPPIIERSVAIDEDIPEPVKENIEEAAEVVQNAIEEANPEPAEEKIEQEAAE